LARVLLLLARLLLAATLLLAGLLTRVLVLLARVLLARILVRIGHSGSPFVGPSTRQPEDDELVAMEPGFPHPLS
jgi:hypothetical protein